MQPLCCFAFTFLCSLSITFAAPSLQCNEITKYSPKNGGGQLCCDKCRPVQLCSASNNATKCKPCDPGRFMNLHNTQYACNFCDKCEEPNMEYESRCNSTHNSVCKCKAGYRCEDQPCKKCLRVASTTKPTTPPQLTGIMSSTIITVETTKDTVWLMAMIALLSVGIAACLVMKKNMPLLWITSNCGCLLTKTHEPVSEDEGVTKPVQEAGSATAIKIDP